jgi:tRNA(fMet)-specific endonuclease VapC
VRSWTGAASHAYGRIEAVLERRSTRIGDPDAAIRAHALTTDARLVTADRDHMARVPELQIEDWGRSGSG